MVVSKQVLVYRDYVETATKKRLSPCKGKFGTYRDHFVNEFITGVE
jgi:hypothetical protein